MVDETISNREPVLNIGVVSRMTDIQEATLRMWERRYHFPKSTRTAGGHRLYSQHEVLRLQWVKARLNEGMSISQSIRALHQLEQQNAIEFDTSSVYLESNDEQQHIITLQQELFRVLIQHDKQKIDEVLARASIVFSPETLVVDLIRPILKEIGDAWSRDEIGVATEHFASHYLRQYLLNWIRVAPPPYNVNPVILVCAPGELHEGGLLIISVLLGRLRWPILYLGQTMPLTELAKLTKTMQPCVVVFSATLEETAFELSRWQSLLIKDDAQQLIVAYGGEAFITNPTLIEKIPGIYLGDTLPESVDTLNKLLHQLYPKLY